ncbi:hypothetical protein Sjap_017778 [Stephania japonica]|uniref:Uncharacterized protein n=1 Tax=Stephania japonica TaxID=461633 RepID=A0AAP0NJW7_9MAGN
MITCKTKRELGLHTRGGKQLAKLRFKAKKATEEKLDSRDGSHRAQTREDRDYDSRRVQAVKNVCAVNDIIMNSMISESLKSGIRETVHIEPKRERIEIMIRGECRRARPLFGHGSGHRDDRPSIRVWIRARPSIRYRARHVQTSINHGHSRGRVQNP